MKGHRKLIDTQVSNDNCNLQNHIDVNDWSPGPAESDHKW